MNVYLSPKFSWKILSNYSLLFYIGNIIFSMIRWKKKNLFISLFSIAAIGIVAPVTAILLLKKPLEEVIPTKDVKMEKPFSLLSNISNFNEQQFKKIKREQCDFSESNINGKWSLKNEWAIFVFEENLFVPEFIGTHSEAKKFVQSAFENAIVTSRILSFNKPVTINVKRFNSSMKTSGNFRITSESDLEINLYWMSSELLHNKELTHKRMNVIFAHEWGHAETMLANSFKEMNVAFEKMMNEFNVLYPDFPANTYKLLDKIIPTINSNKNYLNQTNMKQEYKWNENLKIVNNVRNFINSRNFSTLASYSSDNKTILPEIVTRLQLLYTTNFLDNYSPTIYLQTALCNITDLVSLSNYDFFDGNKNLQSYDWIRLVLRYLYEFDGKIHFDNFKNEKGELSIWANGYASEIFNKIRIAELIWNDDTKTQLQFKHSDIPIGFYKNPFNKNFDYTYIINSAYAKRIAVAKSIKKELKRIDFFDKEKKLLKNIQYSIDE